MISDALVNLPVLHVRQHTLAFWYVNMVPCKGIWILTLSQEDYIQPCSGGFTVCGWQSAFMSVKCLANTPVALAK